VSMQPGSPLSSPAKNAKKRKVSCTSIVQDRRFPLADGTISYTSFANCEKGPVLPLFAQVTNFGQNTPLGPPGAKSQSKIPSRLRESSIASFLEPEATGASPGSRSSSPGTAATPTSSVLGNGKVNGTSGGGDEKRIPPHIPTPPKPPPPVTRRPETDYLVGKHVVMVFFFCVHWWLMRWFRCRR
jgi:hypothetical protein